VSALSDIYAEIDARLGQLEGVEEYDRMPAGDPSAFPALQAYDGGDEPVEGEVGATRLAALLTLEGYVEGYSGSAAHDQMTDLHATAVFALCGDGGDLGGLVETIEISGGRRVGVTELSSTRRLGFAQDFAITFATERGNPALRA